jgi:hypothetical protein
VPVKIEIAPEHSENALGLNVPASILLGVDEVIE